MKKIPQNTGQLIRLKVN